MFPVHAWLQIRAVRGHIVLVIAAYSNLTVSDTHDVPINTSLNESYFLKGTVLSARGDPLLTVSSQIELTAQIPSKSPEARSIGQMNWDWWEEQDIT